MARHIINVKLIAAATIILYSADYTTNVSFLNRYLKERVRLSFISSLLPPCQPMACRMYLFVCVCVFFNFFIIIFWCLGLLNELQIKKAVPRGPMKLKFLWLTSFVSLDPSSRIEFAWKGYSVC